MSCPVSAIIHMISQRLRSGFDRRAVRDVRHCNLCHKMVQSHLRHGLEIGSVMLSALPMWAD